MLLQSKRSLFEKQLIYDYIIPIGIVIIALFILFRLVRIARFYYALRYEKLVFNHVYFRLRKLTPVQHSILKKECSFYGKLSNKHKQYFEHRVATFIRVNKFVPKEGLIITDQMKVLIAATAIMLTFGFRKYLLNLVNTIIIYPKSFYSNTNEAYHKGEFNPQLKVIVFSWEDFLHGYKIGDDNLNLGIHEFGHVIHINALHNSDTNSIIFNQKFRELTEYLQKHKLVRENLIASKYFRAYAYTNHYEFFAVLLENFIETPVEFKSQFPRLYANMKQMLNFNYAGY